MRTFHDLQGKEVALGRFLGRGGEGAVYSVPSRPRLVAKIYVKVPDPDMDRKLAAMVELGTEALATLATWPQDLLRDPSTRSIVGFLMPRVEDHRGIHALYGPTNRKTAFPDATWTFLVRAARNVAASFDNVHQHGHVIGDVNEGNVVVSQTATVRLIDCDSFQIRHGGRTYPCRVGVPLYTPPELHGQRLEEVVRTPNHDCFGLAVLVFQLLFMGRHPFAGRHLERALPVLTAIHEGLFAFGQEAAGHGWTPPPFSLRLEDVPPSLAHLFERAFEGQRRSEMPRPTAAEWAKALDEIETAIVICAKDPRHAHATPAVLCPWCRIETEGGPSFFPPPLEAKRRRRVLAPVMGNLDQDLRRALDVVEQYVSLGFVDDAKDATIALAARYPRHPAVAAKMAELGLGEHEAQVPPSLGEPSDGAGMLDLGAELDGLFEAQAAVQAPRTTASTDLGDAGLADIFKEFSKGLDKQLGKEDYDTRYNLGIAYKEMGLVDEAIAEFQLAARDESRLLECCSMLGLCFLEKGMAKLAAKWFEKGLAAPDRTEEEYQGLHHNLVTALEAAGETDRALQLFEDLYAQDANFRGVARKGGYERRLYDQKLVKRLAGLVDQTRQAFAAVQGRLTAEERATVRDALARATGFSGEGVNELRGCVDSLERALRMLKALGFGH